MKTIKKQTRFMNGNIDVEGQIYDILVSEYGINEVMSLGIDFDSAIYSDGFINAINNGLVPSIENIHESFSGKLDKEYHHIIIDDKCFVMYFN